MWTRLITDLFPRFSRGSVQTILPLNQKLRTGRLCSSYDEKIKDLEKDALSVWEETQRCRKRKRDSEERLEEVQHDLQSVKVITDWKLHLFDWHAMLIAYCHLAVCVIAY